jgi:hypothetical protein
VTTVGRLLAALGITPQKPLRQADERDPEAVVRWEQETYPMLRRRAKKRGAAIFFLDEAGVRRGQPKGSFPQARSAAGMAPPAANVCRHWRRAVQSGSFLRALPPAAGVAARCPEVQKPAGAPWVEKPRADWTPTAPGADAGQGSAP